MLIARIVVDVYCDASERRYFGGELVEAGVVLPADGGWVRGMVSETMNAREDREGAYCSRS